MLTVIRDELGFIQAACDWWPVDDNGNWNPYGRYIWVEQLEVNSLLDGRKVIQKIIHDIGTRAPWAIAAYWIRRDSTADKQHAYGRSRLMKREVVS